MNIFLDIISPVNTIILFDNERNILSKTEFNILLNESSKLILEIDNFLKINNLDFFDIKNIVLVSGPGSFTGIRSNTIVINTINYVIKANLTPITYFELFDNYPIIKKSSKRDSFLKLNNEDFVILQNEDLIKELKTNNIKTIYGDFICEDFKTITLPNYEKIIKNIIFQNLQIITPYYAKKPSIS